MFPSKIGHLLKLLKVEHKVEHNDHRKEAIKLAERLCVILRYMASGNWLMSIGSKYQFPLTCVQQSPLRLYWNHILYKKPPQETLNNKCLSVGEIIMTCPPKDGCQYGRLNDDISRIQFGCCY